MLAIQVVAPIQVPSELAASPIHMKPLPIKARGGISTLLGSGKQRMRDGLPPHDNRQNLRSCARKVGKSAGVWETLDGGEG